MKPIVSHLLQQGILCVNYLNDFFVIGKTAELCRVNTEKLTSMLISLDFVINWKKSSVIPSTN